MAKYYTATLAKLEETEVCQLLEATEEELAAIKAVKCPEGRGQIAVLMNGCHLYWEYGKYWLLADKSQELKEILAALKRGERNLLAVSDESLESLEA